MRESHGSAGLDGAQAATKLSEREVCDAYLYLLGRALVLRQEHLELAREGFRWNELVHRPVGGVGWANPNLDVVYSEAWVALDETSCTVIEIPEIRGRYYTVQIVSPWGETIANINERNYAAHPFGKFALCMKGTSPSVSSGIQRVDVPGRKCRLLCRIELGRTPNEAFALQKQIMLRPTGQPRVAAPVAIADFTNDKLPGVELFDPAMAVLAAERDINLGTEAMQTAVRTVAGATRDPIERGRIDRIIRRKAWRQLAQAVAGMGVVSHGWVQPKLAGSFGDDWLARTVANLTGIWSNTRDEVIYFGAGTTNLLSGSDTHTMTFAPHDPPGAHVRYSWSVTCVDATNYRVFANPEHRYVLASSSKLHHAEDRSLTLYFAPERPSGAPHSNWLPTPRGQRYLLTWRSYGPDRSSLLGVWFPPRLEKR